MSGEQASAEWTVETLRTYMEAVVNERHMYYEQRLDELERSIATAFTASEKAISKADTANEKRFASVNEFRQTLTDQAGTFITRNEAQALLARSSERLDDLTDRMNRNDGKGVGLNAGWMYILGAVAALGTIVSLYLLIKPGG